MVIVIGNVQPPVREKWIRAFTKARAHHSRQKRARGHWISGIGERMTRTSFQYLSNNEEGHYNDICLEVCSSRLLWQPTDFRQLSLHLVQFEELFSLNDTVKYMIDKFTLLLNFLHVVQMITAYIQESFFKNTKILYGFWLRFRLATIFENGWGLSATNNLLLSQKRKEIFF